MSYRSRVRTHYPDISLTHLYPSPAILRASASASSTFSVFRPNSRFKLQDKTETDPGPLRLTDSNYLPSKYSSFEARKSLFTKDTPATVSTQPLIRRSWRYQLNQPEADPGKVAEKGPEDDNSKNNEIPIHPKSDAEARNINKSENDKSVSEESKQIIQKSLDAKSDGDESNENVIKSKSSDNGCDAENPEIETETGNISSKISVKNTLGRPGKGRRNLRRNKTKSLTEAVTVTCPTRTDPDSDPLNSVEIKSAAQWRAISQRVSWKSRETSLDTEETEEKCGGRRSRSSVDLSDRCDRPLTITAPAATDFPASLQRSMITLSQLRNICWRVKPWTEKKDRGLFTSLYGRGWGVDCDEVVAGLYIGDKAAISNTAFLKKQKITHVLNAAEGRDEGMIDLSSDDFQDSNISYLGLTVWDSPLCNILPHLGVAAHFINSALTGGGRVMVSCQMGVSRSAACVLAYLIIHQDMTILEALRTVRRSRDVRPNDGFLEQLIILDTDLRQEPGERLISLGSVRDKDRLPRPWNFEFFSRPVTEEEVGTPLVHLGQDCPLRLSGFSSLNETPSFSNSVSRRNSRKVSRFSVHSGGFHQDSRSRSCDILEETDDDLETDLELDQHDSDLPTLERVKEIITEPEESWRYSQCCQTSVTDLIQPPPEPDLLSLIKVTSAAQWRSISTNIDVTLDQEDEEAPAVPVEDTTSSTSITTSKQVLFVCWQVKPWESPKDSRLFTSLYASGWGCDCDEMVPGIFIGDKQTVKNIRFLKKLGITHVLNAAEGPWEDYGFVDLNPDFYKDTDIHYQGFCLWDTVGCDISPYFGPAAQFIHTALEGGGKVVINCQMGVSRSSVLTMAYMILVRQWTLLHTITEFRKRRDVRPNDDFIDQIVCLHNQFRRDPAQCLAAQNKLSDLPALARPWHLEFWRQPPDQSDLPFRLRPLADRSCDPLTDKIAALNTDIMPRDIILNTSNTITTDSAASPDCLPQSKTFSSPQMLLAEANPFKFAESGVERREIARSESESSWEYYTDSESEADSSDQE